MQEKPQPSWKMSQLQLSAYSGVPTRCFWLRLRYSSSSFRFLECHWAPCRCQTWIRRKAPKNRDTIIITSLVCSPRQHTSYLGCSVPGSRKGVIATWTPEMDLGVALISYYMSVKNFKEFISAKFLKRHAFTCHEYLRNYFCSDP